MKILVTGGSGFVGQALVSKLEENGHECWKLSRTPGDKTLLWDVDEGKLRTAELEGFDGVIHLAGENIFGRWTGDKKKRIYESRIKGTALLVQHLLQLENKPSFFFSTSAIGYYGDRGDEELTEDSKPGHGFLAKTCVDWEQETAPIEDQVRTCKLRLGVVLSAEGGALQKMLKPFKLGLGGKVGTGRQYMSWIALQDLVRAILFLIEKDDLSGTFNLVAPAPTRQEDFARSLASCLGRPSAVPTPAWALKMAVGEMAEGVLLASAKVLPHRLTDAGFRFDFPDLETALKSELKEAS